MEWFKKHVDTVIILSAFAASVLWMNGKFNGIDKEFAKVQGDFAVILQEIAVMKTVMIMKNIMPAELAVKHE